jgi:hypothetical protein
MGATVMSCECNESGNWDQKAYMSDQCEEVQKHKWIESEKAGYDLGQEAVMDWIMKHAAAFRKYAILSGRYSRKP